jgi:hypothetical protein
MSPNPLGFLDHLRTHGYHPRSDKHSNVLAELIVQDLVAHCPKVREKAAIGRIVYDVNFDLRAGTAGWNVDLVLGPPEFGVGAPDSSVPILKRSPSTIEIAVEIKSVMTEHRKAIKNRKRDLEAHHEHVHHYSDAAIAAGVLVVNASETFKSPLRAGPTIHRDPLKLVQHCVDEMRAISVRGGKTGPGLEARCVIVVVHDNVNLAVTNYFTRAPAPKVGDPLHYDAFVQTICSQYSSRF